MVSKFSMVKNAFGYLTRYLILCGFAFLGSALIFNNVKATEPPIAVIIYDGENHTGESIAIRHNTPSLGSMNKKMTSFKVSSGFAVRFYEGENYTGGYYSKTSTAREAKKVAYDNRVQSVEILVDGTPEDQKPPLAVTIFDGENHSGTSLEIRYDTPSFGTMNKKLSSFKVSAGYQVRFFSEDNYQGGYYTRDSDDKDGKYAKDFDNRVSSVKILRAPDASSSGSTSSSDFISTSDHEGETFYEINLDQTFPAKLPTTSVNALQIEELAKPEAVNLDKNMYIEEATFFNKTSLVIEKFFVEQNGEVTFIELDQAIPAYSSAYLGNEWQKAQLMQMTQLGNNQMFFGELYSPASRSRTQLEPLVDITDSEGVIVEPEEPPPVITRTGENPDALRRFNATERDSSERVQRYERFWINSPDTLHDIIKHVSELCEVGGHYTECKNYPHPPERYATDMFFAQSVSGYNSSMWVKSSVWGAATLGHKELVDSTRVHNVNLWMNPRLMANMLSANSVTAIDAEQGLIHEYYHNLGYGHNSGWPSSAGIDNLFGDIAYNVYRDAIADRYVISNLAFVSKKLDSTTYEFEVYSFDTTSTLTLRLLSTQNLNAKITQTKTNKFTVTFTEFPSTDVYVSLFTENSEQMASTALDVTASFAGNTQLANLNQNFQDLVDKYNKIYVYTVNGGWTRDFNLPPNAPEGTTVIFSSNASYYSNINFTEGRYRITTGNKITMRFEDGAWKLVTE